MIQIGSKIASLGGEPAFWCPGCRMPHRINVNTPNPFSGATWKWNGSGDKPTFEPSIHVVGQCHSFVRDGNIQFLPDCSHKLAGTTVELPDWDIEERSLYQDA